MSLLEESSSTTTKSANSNNQDDKSEKSESISIVKPKDTIDENDIIELESQSTANICADETNLEQQGYRFYRQKPVSLSPFCLYRAEIPSSLNQQNQSIVCKIISLDTDFIRTREKENFLANSIRIIRFVCGYNRSEARHKMFIHVYEIFKIDTKIYIFMEERTASHTILHMIKHHTKFTQSEGRKWIQLICDAIRFLHLHGIAHRSIKLEMILIPTTNSQEPKLFGLNRSVFYIDRINSNQIIQQKREIRSFNNYHLPPESFRDTYYNPALADIWSIGVLLVAIHTKRYVFNVKSKIDFNQQWKKFVKKHKINPIIANLLDGIFLNNPCERSTLKSIMEHEYFHVPEDRIEAVVDQNVSNEKRSLNSVNDNTNNPKSMEMKQSIEFSKSKLHQQRSANESNTDTSLKSQIINLDKDDAKR